MALCGAIKADGSPCTNPVKERGRCGIAAHQAQALTPRGAAGGGRGGGARARSPSPPASSSRPTAAAARGDLSAADLRAIVNRGTIDPDDHTKDVLLAVAAAVGAPATARMVKADIADAINATLSAKRAGGKPMAAAERPGSPPRGGAAGGAGARPGEVHGAAGDDDDSLRVGPDAFKHSSYNSEKSKTAAWAARSETDAYTGAARAAFAKLEAPTQVDHVVEAQLLSNIASTIVEKAGDKTALGRGADFIRLGGLNDPTINLVNTCEVVNQFKGQVYRHLLLTGRSPTWEAAVSTATAGLRYARDPATSPVLTPAITAGRMSEADARGLVTRRVAATTADSWPRLRTRMDDFMASAEATRTETSSVQRILADAEKRLRAWRLT